jgi:hypothetical protein
MAKRGRATASTRESAEATVSSQRPRLFRHHMRSLQSDLHRQLRAEAVAARERIAQLARPIDPAKLNEHPEPSGWSVGQVLEHLCRAEEMYYKPVLELLNKSPRDASAATRDWKPSFLGGRIASALQNVKPIKRGPKALRPGLTPRNGVVEAFHAGEMRFVQVMDDALGYDWRALRLRSPALPPLLPKMNLGDAFRIHVVHLARHARQIERLAPKL